MRNSILVLLASLVLPLIFVATQGLLAQFRFPFLLSLSSFIDERHAFFISLYLVGCVGSFAAAFGILFPFGFFVHWNPHLLGLLVGLAAVVQLILVAQIVALNIYIEYAFLILSCPVAAALGYKARVKMKRWEKHGGIRLD
jgi:hypothetical protein